jgi:hypothetical protein
MTDANSDGIPDAASDIDSAQFGCYDNSGTMTFVFK